MNSVPPLIQFKDVVVFELYGDELRADALRGLGSQVMERLKTKNVNNLPQLSEHLSLHDGSLVRCVKNNNFYTISIMCPVEEEVRQEVETSVPKFDDIKVSDKKPIVMVFMVEKIWSEMNTYLRTGGAAYNFENGRLRNWSDDSKFFESDAPAAYELATQAYPLPGVDIATYVKRFERIYVKIWSNGKYKIVSESEALSEYCRPDPWSIILWRRFMSFYNPDLDHHWCNHSSELVNFAVGQHALEPRYQKIFSFGRDILLGIVKTTVAFAWTNNKEPQSNGYAMYGLKKIEPKSVWHDPVTTNYPETCIYWSELGDEYYQSAEEDMTEISYPDIGFLGKLFSKGYDGPVGGVFSSYGVVWYGPSLGEGDYSYGGIIALPISAIDAYKHFIWAANWDNPNTPYPSLAATSVALSDPSVGLVFEFIMNGDGPQPAYIQRWPGYSETTPGYFTCTTTETATDNPVNVPDDKTMHLQNATWLRPRGLYPGRCAVGAVSGSDGLSIVLEGGSAPPPEAYGGQLPFWESDSLIDKGICPKFAAIVSNGELINATISESSVSSDATTVDALSGNILKRRSFYEFTPNELIDAPSNILFEYETDIEDTGISPNLVTKFEITSGDSIVDIVDTLILELMGRYGGRIYAPAVILPKQKILLGMVGG